MAAPRLPDVERLAHKLADAIRRQPPSPKALWHISGPSTAGKSALLHALATRLNEADLWPIIVAPPPGALDAGPTALVKIGGALKSRGAIDGHLDSLVEPRRPWADKLLDVRAWLSKTEERVVLLCDEPFEWPARATDDSHFAARTDDVVSMLLAAVSYRRVVVGQLPRGHKPLAVEQLKPASDPGAWLSDTSEWGSLAQTAKALRVEAEASLGGYSPLEIRLLVALAAVSSAAEVAAWLPQIESRREISRRLAEQISQRQDLKPLCDLWARLALVRRPFAKNLLQILGAEQPEPLASEILRHCLLYVQGDLFILHDTLRTDARDKEWLDRRMARNVHKALAEYYAARFRQAAAGDEQSGAALLDEMEAFHHATKAGDPDCWKNLQTFFVDQLDALGRALSREVRNYQAAATVFERAVAWDENDDYAHHYLAFNLDVGGREPSKVEEHYQRAIELHPDNTWWQSRWISFLITRGRVADARRAWDDALDVLGLPDVDADPSVYENLHLWVARLLLHRGQLDFAERVLKGIPPEVRERHPGLRASERRLGALLEARRTGVFVPGYYLRPNWWKEGPYLLQRQLESGHRLVRWLAGRVDEVSAGELHLRVAVIERDGTASPPIARMSIPFKEFDTWNPDEKGAKLEAGRFIEIGTYAKARSSAEMHARVHADRGWHDEDLPPLFPDPTRYLRGFARNS